MHRLVSITRQGSPSNYKVICYDLGQRYSPAPEVADDGGVIGYIGQ